MGSVAKGSRIYDLLHSKDKDDRRKADELLGVTQPTEEELPERIPGTVERGRQLHDIKGGVGYGRRLNDFRYGRGEFAPDDDGDDAA